MQIDLPHPDKIIEDFENGFSENPLYPSDEALVAKLGRFSEEMLDRGYECTFTIKFVEEIQSYCVYYNLHKIGYFEPDLDDEV